MLGTLSKRERKARHLAAVEYLSEQAADPDLPAILAGHLVSAYEAHPTAPDAPDIRRRALRLTLDAAQRAESVGALNEAVGLFAQAAQIETDESRRAEHLVRAARCAERYGNEEVAAGHYAAAGKLYEQVGQTRNALRMRARELSAYRWSRPASELIEPLREVYEDLRGEEDAAFADAAVSLAGSAVFRRCRRAGGVGVGASRPSCATRQRVRGAGTGFELPRIGSDRARSTGRCVTPVSGGARDPPALRAVRGARVARQPRDHVHRARQIRGGGDGRAGGDGRRRATRQPCAPQPRRAPTRPRVVLARPLGRGRVDGRGGRARDGSGQPWDAARSAAARGDPAGRARRSARDPR